MAENHVSFAVVFDAPEGKDFKDKFADMYKIVKNGTSECLFYGFATCGNRVLCREGYTSAQGAVAHGKEVKEIFQEVVGQIGADKVKMLGMASTADLEVLKPHLEPRGAKLIPLDSGSLAPVAMPKGCADNHITILVEFTVPDGKMDDFKAGFPKFYKATKEGAGAAGCYYYSFGVLGNTVFCREGYKDAEAVQAHGADIKGMMEEPMKAIGAGNMKINVVGPQAEIDKLRPKLEPRGAVFWNLDSGALWR